MNNNYLEINITHEGYMKINSNDGVFSSLTTVIDKEDLSRYCNEKADMWLTSKLGNFNGWSKKDRKIVADKWLKVKELSEGDYNFYFNLESITDLFKNGVEDLAKKMGITNYTLKIN